MEHTNRQTDNLTDKPTPDFINIHKQIVFITINHVEIEGAANESAPYTLPDSESPQEIEEVTVIQEKILRQ